MMPEVPSGSYFADGLATISTRSIDPAGSASNNVFPLPPLNELGRPLIKIITDPSPRSVTPPSSSTSTEGSPYLERHLLFHHELKYLPYIIDLFIYTL